MTKVSPEYRDARRAHIIATAREQFSRKGLAYTSMSDLVAAAGMSMGGFYRYFGSKDELIAAVAEGRDGSVDGGFPETESPREVVARLLTYVTEPEGTPHARLVAQIWADAAVRPELAEIVRATHNTLIEYFAARVREARGVNAPSADDVRPSIELAQVVLAALIGYAQLTATGFEVAPEVFERTLSELLPAD
ncbi:MAG: hypothetical protein AUG49_13280 [Catenulispora sp. 13_1_20CM_3_70_7]|nr:MAG: hypothetical protein AUG49_13280 [Catenulispora sp. 13_1_20CM_3_70_7]